MTQISEGEILKLKGFVESKLYERVKTQVLEELDSFSFGSNRDSANIQIDLAIEKGVQMAFKQLESLTSVKSKKFKPAQPRAINKRNEAT